MYRESEVGEAARLRCCGAHAREVVAARGWGSGGSPGTASVGLLKAVGSNLVCAKDNEAPRGGRAADGLAGLREGCGVCGRGEAAPRARSG